MVCDLDWRKDLQFFSVDANKWLDIDGVVKDKSNKVIVDEDGCVHISYTYKSAWGPLETNVVKRSVEALRNRPQPAQVWALVIDGTPTRFSTYKSDMLEANCERAEKGLKLGRVVKMVEEME